MIFLWFVLSFNLPSDMQNVDLPDLHLAHRKKTESKASPNFYVQILMKMIKVYQQSFSAVQGDVCNFIPSCSHFGYDALNHFGLIKGLLLTSDRLQRCHPGAWKYLKNYYTIATDSIRGERLYDPVEKYK